MFVCLSALFLMAFVVLCCCMCVEKGILSECVAQFWQQPSMYSQCKYNPIAATCNSPPFTCCVSVLYVHQSRFCLFFLFFSRASVAHSTSCASSMLPVGCPSLTCTMYKQVYTRCCTFTYECLTEQFRCCVLQPCRAKPLFPTLLCVLVLCMCFVLCCVLVLCIVCLCCALCASTNTFTPPVHCVCSMI